MLTCESTNMNFVWNIVLLIQTLKLYLERKCNKAAIVAVVFLTIGITTMVIREIYLAVHDLRFIIPYEIIFII